MGRFLSADSIVPGAADSSGGGAATLGYDQNTRLTPLTTDFHEFVAQVGDENRLIDQYGPFFKWDEKVRKEHPIPMGPSNPQALNRYSYVLNTPLKYIDPSGHDGWIRHYHVDYPPLTREQARDRNKGGALMYDILIWALSIEVGVLSGPFAGGATGLLSFVDDLSGQPTRESQEGDWGWESIYHNTQSGEYVWIEMKKDAEGNIFYYRYRQSNDGLNWYIDIEEYFYEEDNQ